MAKVFAHTSGPQPVWGDLPAASLCTIVLCTFLHSHRARSLVSSRFLWGVTFYQQLKMQELSQFRDLVTESFQCLFHNQFQVVCRSVGDI